MARSFRNSHTLPSLSSFQCPFSSKVWMALVWSDHYCGLYILPPMLTLVHIGALVHILWGRTLISREHHEQGTPWVGNTMNREHHEYGKPWAGNTMSREHHEQGTPWAGNTMNREHHEFGKPWVGTPWGGNILSWQWLEQGVLWALSTLSREKHEQRTPQAGSTMSRKHLKLAMLWAACPMSREHHKQGKPGTKHHKPSMITSLKNKKLYDFYFKHKTEFCLKMFDTNFQMINLPSIKRLRSMESTWSLFYRTTTKSRERPKTGRNTAFQRNFQWRQPTQISRLRAVRAPKGWLCIPFSCQTTTSTIHKRTARTRNGQSPVYCWIYPSCDLSIRHNRRTTASKTFENLYIIV